MMKCRLTTGHLSRSAAATNTPEIKKKLVIFELAWIGSKMCDWMSKWKNTICKKLVRTKKMTYILTFKDEVLEYDKCNTREQKQDVWLNVQMKNTICEKFVQTKKITNILTLKDEVLEYDKCKTREQKQDVWLNVQMKIHNLWKICLNKKMTSFVTLTD